MNVLTFYNLTNWQFSNFLERVGLSVSNNFMKNLSTTKSNDLID